MTHLNQSVEMRNRHPARFAFALTGGDFDLGRIQPFERFYSCGDVDDQGAITDAWLTGMDRTSIKCFVGVKLRAAQELGLAHFACGGQASEHQKTGGQNKIQNRHCITT
jgi:hypothetical protein